MAVDLGRVTALEAEFSLADGPSGVARSATRDAEFSLAQEADCFPLQRRGRKRLGSLRELSAGGVFSEDAGEVRSARRRVGGMGSATQLR